MGLFQLNGAQAPAGLNQSPPGKLTRELRITLAMALPVTVFPARCRTAARSDQETDADRNRSGHRAEDN